jgi:DtxR family Mn-dependent transcriptional regulator
MPDPLLSLVIAGAVTAVGLLTFWPDRGLFWRWQRANQMTARVLREDALKHMYHFENHGDKPSLISLAGALSISANQVAEVVKGLHSLELIQHKGADFFLTPSGRDYALRIIRAHRLYERYLSEETGFEEADWHSKAHDFEHQLSPEEIEALAARLGNPTHDPHGDPIPTADGVVVYPEGRTTITSIPIDTPARIIHLEDEPEAFYAQLVAEGLHIGQEIRLIEDSPQRVRFWAGDDEHVLAPILAANITVIPVTDEPKEDKLPGEPLTNLKPGDDAQVVSLSPRIRGVERRRLMDLGILPGTVIQNEMASAGGDPIAYRVRGALIALRKSQAELISVCREGREC